MDDFKEVRFDIYCGKCEYSKKEGYEDPCNECLEQGMREGTEKPLNWEKREESRRG